MTNSKIYIQKNKKKSTKDDFNSNAIFEVLDDFVHSNDSGGCFEENSFSTENDFSQCILDTIDDNGEMTAGSAILMLDKEKEKLITQKKQNQKNCTKDVLSIEQEYKEFSDFQEKKEKSSLSFDSSRFPVGREYASEQLYLQEINKIPLLSAEEEFALAQKIYSKNTQVREEAMQTLVKANLRLVVFIARRFFKFGLPLQDLISEGNIGLLNAVQRFNPQKGRFTTYASCWIRQAIFNAISKNSRMVRLPRHAVERLKQIKEAIYSLSVELERVPTDQEIAQKMNVSKKVVVQMRHIFLATDYSVEYENMQLNSMSDSADLLPNLNEEMPDSIMDQTESIEICYSYLAQLSDREREILTCRYGLNNEPPMTLEQMSKRFNITRERIRQIQKSALAKLKSILS